MRDCEKDTDVHNSLLDSVGEGEGGMIWEDSIESCILSYVKQITSPGSMHEGQDGEHIYTHGWFMWMFDKNHRNIVK